MSKSTSKVPSSTIQEKYARLVVTKGARNPVWHAQKDSTLARFSDIQIKFSPTGTSHNLHKVVLDATFDDLELLNEHPLDAALEDLVLRLVYHTVLPAQVPLDLDQSIALWVRLVADFTIAAHATQVFPMESSFKSSPNILSSSLPLALGEPHWR